MGREVTVGRERNPAAPLHKWELGDKAGVFPRLSRRHIVRETGETVLRVWLQVWLA